MLQWCLEHPWMTFFIVLASIQGVTYSIKYITGYQDIKEKE